MSGVLHWLGNWMGLENASGPIYSFWSGIFGDASILAVPFVIWRTRNCHVHGCIRLGKHPVKGTQYKVCRKHHPDGHLTHDKVLADHAEANTQPVPTIINVSDSVSTDDTAVTSTDS